MLSNPALPVRPWLVLAALASAGPARAAPLPEPLTLEYALSLAGEANPPLEMARAGLTQARAELEIVKAREGVNVNAEGRARWVEPPSSFPNEDHDDHKASLFIRKNLYDFGRTTALKQVAHDRISAADLRYQDALVRRRILIMQRYFDVLLADLDFAHKDETMAVVYVKLDRLRQRHELGQVSDVELLKSESEYQSARRQRVAAEGQQRLTRAVLSDVLNRPGELPVTLEKPALPQIKRKLPDADRLYEAALARNPEIRALRALEGMAEARVEEARAEGRPRLNGELEASAYSRKLASNDAWRAGLYLDVPLLTGGTVPALTSQRQAEVYEARARLRQGEMDMRQAILELSLQLQTLKAQQEEADALRTYREAYLDRSRTIYEQEVTADLGDAMALYSEAELAVARAQYATALTWERLDALTGGPVTVEERGP